MAVPLLRLLSQISIVHIGMPASKIILCLIVSKRFCDRPDPIGFPGWTIDI
jgi:hypothetical protein